MIYRKPVVAIALVTLLAALSACGKLREDRHRTRVQNVLSGIQAEGGTTGDKLNYSMLEWDGGQRKFESVSNEGVFDRFTRWCQEKNINRRIAAFEIVSIEKDASSEPVMSIVTVSIEGTTHRIRVGDEKRMAWVN